MLRPKKKRGLFRVTPRKKLGRVGTFFFLFLLKHIIIFKSILISHPDYFSLFKAMQFIEVCGATIFFDYWTFLCTTGFFF